MKNKQDRRYLAQLLSPFEEMGTDLKYMFGISFNSRGEKVYDGDISEEWRVIYQGGGVFEIESVTSYGVQQFYRGKIPNRAFFVSLMQNIDPAPPIDWEEVKAKEEELILDFIGRQYTDKDGDLGLCVEAKLNHINLPWLNLLYRNNKTSWMPLDFLKEVSNRPAEISDDQ